MGWVLIFTVQATLGARGQIEQHRKFGRLALWWMVLMIVMGFVVTIRMVRNGTVPFFFRPQHFLIFDPLNVLVFAAFVLFAVSKRKQTDWHSRLQLGAMALLMGPAFGRLLPMPLLAPYAYESAGAACALFPLIGISAGWIFTEMGRQPWIVYGLMKTSNGVSPTLTTFQVGLSLVVGRTTSSSGHTASPRRWG